MLEAIVGMETSTGLVVDVLNLQPHEVCIEDIAYSLAGQNRYGAHARPRVNVAEHCCHTHDILPARLKLAGLLHDASECFLVDLPRPLKDIIEQYKRIELYVQAVINERFGIVLTEDDKRIIKDADNAVLLAEARRVMRSKGRGWVGNWDIDGDAVAPVTIQGWTPEQAEIEFLIRFGMSQDHT